MRDERISRNGFTLIELLVVTAIISILIAIILPTLKTAREEAHNAICTSQLDQIFIASFSYGMAWENRLPYFEASGARPYDDEWWVTQIAPGLENQLEMYLCPSDEKPNHSVWLTYLNHHGKRTNKVRMSGRRRVGQGTQGAVGSRDAGSFNLDLSYRGSCDTVETGRYVNGQYICPPAHSSVVFPAVARKFTDWADPSKVIMMVEGGPTQSNDCFRYADVVRFHNMDQYPNSFPAYKRRRGYYPGWRQHNGTSNYLMLDGSIQRLYPEDAGELAKDWRTQAYF